MLKKCYLIFLSAVLLFGGQILAGEEMTPGIHLSKLEAKIAIENASPANGLVIPGSVVTIHWGTRLNSTGKVSYRKSANQKWESISSPSNTLHTIELKNLKPAEKIEYRIIIDLKDGPYEGDVRTFTMAKGGLVFTQREYTFDVERDYQQHCSVAIENQDAQTHQINATVFNPHDDFIVGFVGNGSTNHTIDIPSGGKQLLELVVHTQDSEKEQYTFIINLETRDENPSKDSVRVHVNVAQLNFNVSSQLGEVNPVTLSTTLKLQNQGDALTDFTILPDQALWGRVRIIPQVNHARFAEQAYLKIQVMPLLDIGMRELSGGLILSAGKKQQHVPVSFVVPEGKKIFCAVTQSVHQSSASTHFCTNRKQVKLDLDTPGNGPEEGHIRNTREPYPKPVEEEDDYILEKGEIDFRQIKKNTGDFFAGGLYGDKITDPSGYNIAGQVLFNSVIGWPADVRDIWFSAKNMLDSGFQDHKLDFFLNVVGALPVAGDALKGFGKYKGWGKYVDEIGDVTKGGRRGWTDIVDSAPSKYDLPHKSPKVDDTVKIRGPDVDEGIKGVGKEVGEEVAPKADEIKKNKDVIGESSDIKAAKSEWQQKQPKGKNIASEKRTAHILKGEGSKHGGHMYPGNPGKTVFPEEWTGETIMGNISSIATDSKLDWVPDKVVNGKQRYVVIGVRDGIEIKIVIEPLGEGIITAFPIK